MTAYYLPQDYPPLSSSDLQVVFMSPQPATYGGPSPNPGDVNMSFTNASGFVDSRQDDQYPSQFFSPDSSTIQQPFLIATAPRPFYQSGYTQDINGSMMTMVGPQNVCPPSSRFQSSPQTMFSMQPNPQFFSHPVRFTSNGAYDPAQEIPHESLFCRGKRQRDENYRYSLGCISRRVQNWLEKSKPFADAAQKNLEDQLVHDSLAFDKNDDSFYELFDESRRKRIYSLSVEGSHVSASSAATPHVESPASCSGVMSNPLLFSQATFSDSFSVASPRGVSMSDDMHGSCSTEPDFIVKFPKQIPPICPVAGTKVHFDELTDRSVLRNWRCRTDDADLIFKKGRKRFFKRVAVLPPDSWQPNKRPQTWKWAPSGPFALHLGELVSISGTNGYPYEIVLIRHIPPALRCFLSLVPAPRDLAREMLNGERIPPEFPFVVHIPVDSVTHKWILNGVRPRDYTMDMALEYVNKDIEMERMQKERRKARKGTALSGVEVAADPGLLTIDSIVTASEDDLVKSSGSNESLGVVQPQGLVIDC